MLSVEEGNPRVRLRPRIEPRVERGGQLPLLTWKQWGSSSRLRCSGQTETSLPAPRSSSEIVASDSREPRALGGLAAHVGKLSFLLTPLAPTTCPLQPKWKEPRGN